MQQEHENNVLSAVWPWREGDAEIGRGRRYGDRLKRAAIQAAVMSCVGALFYIFIEEHRYMAIVVWSIAATALAMAIALPRLFDAAGKLGGIVKHAVATALTWILLAPIFYIFFSGGRLVLLLQGKDPMRHGFEDGQDSFWLKYHHPSELEQYEKQH